MIPRNARLLLLAMLGLACIYIPLDWSRIVTHAYRLSPWSNALKLASSYLAAGIAWGLSEKLSLAPGERRRFQILFALAAVADTLFMLHLEPIGVALFMVFHGLLIARNLSGARAALAEGRIPMRVTLLGASVLVLLLAYAGWLLPQVTDPALKLGIPIYVGFVWASLMAAVASIWIGHYPKANARLMALGMVLFLACDLTVGCNLIWPAAGASQVFSSSLTWMLYAPALALIASSAYRAKNHSPLHARAVPLASPISVPGLQSGVPGM